MPDLTRYQRARTTGWSTPENTVIVDRTSRFGNPFTARWAITEGYATTEAGARQVCVVFFASWLDGTVCAPVPDSAARRERVLTNLPDLKGHHLACFCPTPPEGETDMCHAQILIVRANRK
jgi:hypothetical protein